MHSVLRRKEGSSCSRTIRGKNSTGCRSWCQEEPSQEEDLLLHSARHLTRKEPASQAPTPPAWCPPPTQCPGRQVCLPPSCAPTAFAIAGAHCALYCVLIILFCPHQNPMRKGSIFAPVSQMRTLRCRGDEGQATVPQLGVDRAKFSPCSILVSTCGDLLRF